MYCICRYMNDAYTSKEAATAVSLINKDLTVSIEGYSI